eukprot:GHVQ01022460.1.p1 GENE.GHVQ01022460.1~~GHVQ01022460.1.p1  ORF type:complete len:152 (+),score=14.64 GHVQ01022460.1:206-661(+)
MYPVSLLLPYSRIHSHLTSHNTTMAYANPLYPSYPPDPHSLLLPPTPPTAMSSDTFRQPDLSSSHSFISRADRIPTATRPFPVHISPAFFPEIAIVLLAFGLMVTAVLFIYEVSNSRLERRILKEFILALLAASFLGLGSAFLLLWCGVYF